MYSKVFSVYFTFMGKRTDWLSESAKPIAEKLAVRFGSQKQIVSAGVMALNACTPEEREHYMALASGEEVIIASQESQIARVLVKIIKEADYYGLPEGDRKYLDAARRILTADTAGLPPQEVAPRRRRKPA